MNYKAFLSCLIVFLALLSGCAVPEQEKADVVAEYDLTGRYELIDGEAVVSDVSFSSDYVTDDNCRVFYEIFVGSFSDSDGDGVGDLRGIIDRLDYLNDGDPGSGKSLGVEGIWLSPIFKSPSYHKYDVTDYYAVDKRFGTEDDLRELVEKCHQRNIKLILDLPINHTGELNKWFGEFKVAQRAGNTQSPYYDLYCWYDPAAESCPSGRRFMPLSGTEHQFECNFSDQMPELNFDSALAREFVLDVARYYLDMGVDGFRFDAAKYIYLGDNARSSDFWSWYLGELRAIKPDLYTVAEVWDSDGITDFYYPATNCFNFTTSQVNGLIAESAKAGNVNKYTAYVEKYIQKVTSLRSDAMMIPFLANHDTDRSAGYLTVASGQAKAAANLYLLSPGSPFIYYGEEIGLRGSRGGANTDANRRLAMLWGDGDTVADPEGATYDSSKQIDSSVTAQLADGDSLYSYYKRLLMIRAANPEIARGEYKALSIPDSKLGGFTSTWNGNTVCVIHNTTLSEKTLDLSEVTELPFDTLSAAIGMGGASLDGGVLTLGSQTSVVLRISGD